jgi:antagonist of KipI
MSLHIIKGGLIDTVQDYGRRGYQHLGINVGGVMDRFSAGLANALLGKDLAAPLLELHYPASVLEFSKDTVICLAGADFAPVVDGEAVPMNQPVVVPKGGLLRFTGVREGTWCYLAVLNDLKADPWLGSYSTNLRAEAGGFKGRQLKTGDVLPFVKELHLDRHPFHSGVQHLPWKAVGLHALTRNEICIFYGSEWSWLAPESREALLHNSYYVSSASDRMGYQLTGEPLRQSNTEQLVSTGVTFGTVQLLPSGALIVLMADGQTTGGYPRVAHVVSAHLPALAQLKPHESFRFCLADNAVAEQQLVEQQDYLLKLQKTCAARMKDWLHGHKRGIGD